MSKKFTSKAKVFLLFSIFSFLVACGTPPKKVYVDNRIKYKNTGTLEELLKARYECLKEQSNKSNVGNVNVNVNSNRNYQPTIHCAEFGACVATKGFIRSPKGTLILPKEYEAQCRR